MEDIVCPNCGEELSEERLAKSLICPHCATNLKNKKYMDFLEFLMVAEIVQDIDFFDESVYGDEYLRFEESDYDDKDLPDTQAAEIDWDKDPENDYVAEQIGNCYGNLGDYVLASEYFQKAFQINPQNENAKLEFANALNVRHEKNYKHFSWLSVNHYP